MAKKFQNVPDNLQRKMESCVVSVKRTGKSKESAIAICFDSVVKGKSLNKSTKDHELMAKNRQKKKARQRNKAAQEIAEVETVEIKETEEDISEDTDTPPTLETTEEKGLHLDMEVSSNTGHNTGHTDGPTSFAEVDEQKEVRKKVREAEDVIFTADSIMFNIMNAEMDVDEKVGALKKVADDMGARLKSSMSKEVINFGENISGEFTPEIAELETLVRDSKEEDGILDKVVNVGSLLILTEKAKKELADEQFAYVSKEGERFYPVHNKAHLKESLSQVLEEIKNEGANKEFAEIARPVVILKAREMRIGMPSESNSNGILIEKDLKGSWRWIGWVSNNFKDREGEIITEKSHEEYIEFLNNSPQHAPEFRIWHVKGTARENKVDWWSYTKGFLMMSGKLTKKEATTLLKAGEKEPLGMSHSFVAYKNPKEKLILKYRTFEVSDLPRRSAANPWTNLQTHAKETEMSDKLNKEKYLAAQIGEENASALLAMTADTKDALEESKVESKELEQDPEEEPSGDDTQTKDASPEMETLVKAVAKGVAEELNLKALSEWTQNTDKQIGDLAKAISATISAKQVEEDTLISKAITAPIASNFTWGGRPSQSKDNVTNEDGEEGDLIADVKEAEDYAWITGPTEQALKG